MLGFSRPLYLLGVIPIVFYHSEQVRSLLVSLHFAFDGGDLQTNHECGAGHNRHGFGTDEKGTGKCDERDACQLSVRRGVFRVALEYLVLGRTLGSDYSCTITYAMDPNGWYTHTNNTSGYGSTDMADTVEESHSLLSAYPLASLNASGHGQILCQYMEILAPH